MQRIEIASSCTLQELLQCAFYLDGYCLHRGIIQQKLMFPSTLVKLDEVVHSSSTSNRRSLIGQTGTRAKSDRFLYCRNKKSLLLVYSLDRTVFIC